MKLRLKKKQKKKLKKVFKTGKKALNLGMEAAKAANLFVKANSESSDSQPPSP